MKQYKWLLLQKKSYRVIGLIDNPSEAVQKAAIDADYLALKYIVKAGIVPSEEVQLRRLKSLDTIAFKNSHRESPIGGLRQNNIVALLNILKTPQRKSKHYILNFGADNSRGFKPLFPFAVDHFVYSWVMSNQPKFSFL